MKHDLTETTFIIPLRIDSKDRLNNLYCNLAYLTKYFDTNVIVLEADKESKVEKLISEYKDKNITHVFLNDNNSYFHRTKFLNIMLDMVKTKVTVNYDVDVLFPVSAYVECQRGILDDGYDLIYPFSTGMSQRKVHVNNPNRSIFRSTLNLEDFQSIYLDKGASECGHAQFFNTKSYREGFMENESYIAYGPEDKERLWRFYGLGYKLRWNENLVYHMEHARGPDSWHTNPHYKHNWEEYARFLSCFMDREIAKKLIKSEYVSPEDVDQHLMEPARIKEYYSKFDYLKKYQR